MPEGEQRAAGGSASPMTPAPGGRFPTRSSAAGSDGTQVLLNGAGHVRLRGLAAGASADAELRGKGIEQIRDDPSPPGGAAVGPV